MAYSDTVPAWMHQVLPPAASRFFSGHDLAWTVYGLPADAPQSSFTAFAYLWRRFGPPLRGSDPDKDLVCYVLGTPDPGVALVVRLGGTGLCDALGYRATVEDDVPATAAMVELLRPVFIRDVAIDIVGHVPDEALDDRECAPASDYAGYGIPQAAIEALLTGEQDRKGSRADASQ